MNHQLSPSVNCPERSLVDTGCCPERSPVASRWHSDMVQTSNHYVSDRFIWVVRVAFRQGSYGELVMVFDKGTTTRGVVFTYRYYIGLVFID